MVNLSKPLWLGAAIALLMAAPAQAAAVTASGTFSRDDAVHYLSFRTEATGLVLIESFGYAGGTDASGAVVAAGGFDAVFALFDASGTLLGYGDDGATRSDPTTGAALDALLDITLDAGDYVVAISQFDNFAIGPDLAAGFLQSGNAAFTAAYGCAAGRFCDIGGSDRNGNFSLSVSGNTVPAVVPEPATLGLLGLALPGLWLTRRRNRPMAVAPTRTGVAAAP